MSGKTWTAVDDYIVSSLFEADPVLDAVLAANRDQGLPAIDVSAAQGKLLSLLVRIRGAKTVLEVGTLGGYSTIWMARGLPADGKVVTLELDPHHARVARSNSSGQAFRTRSTCGSVPRSSLSPRSLTKMPGHST